jgi:hypothetical protein
MFMIQKPKMMLNLFTFFLLTVTSLADSPYGDFQAPAYTGVNAGPWGTNVVWAIGSKQSVIWNTTFSEYNISLWRNIPGVRSEQAKMPVYSE